MGKITPPDFESLTPNKPLFWASILAMGWILLWWSPWWWQSHSLDWYQSSLDPEESVFWIALAAILVVLSGRWRPLPLATGGGFLAIVLGIGILTWLQSWSWLWLGLAVLASIVNWFRPHVVLPALGRWLALATTWLAVFAKVIPHEFGLMLTAWLLTENFVCSKFEKACLWGLGFTKIWWGGGLALLKTIWSTGRRSRRSSLDIPSLGVTIAIAATLIATGTIDGVAPGLEGVQGSDWGWQVWWQKLGWSAIALYVLIGWLWFREKWWLWLGVIIWPSLTLSVSGWLFIITVTSVDWHWLEQKRLDPLSKNRTISTKS